MLLLLRRKKTPHLPMSASGRSSKQGKPALATNKLTFYAKFHCLAQQNVGQELDVNGDISPCSVLYMMLFRLFLSTVGKEHNHWRPLVVTASPSRVVLTRTLLRTIVCCFPVFALITAQRLLP